MVIQTLVQLNTAVACWYGTLLQIYIQMAPVYFPIAQEGQMKQFSLITSFALVGKFLRKLVQIAIYH